MRIPTFRATGSVARNVFMAMIPLLLCAGFATAQTPRGDPAALPRFDVLCDASVEVYSCHPAHPQGDVLKFDELKSKLNGFGAGTIRVSLENGETLTSRTFKALDGVILVGDATVRPRTINSLSLRSSWPQWGSVASLAAGGAMFFGGIGLVIDGVQWIGGGHGDLGATGRGAVAGAVIFGGLGVLFARETYTVMINEGVQQRTVEIRGESVPVAARSP